MPGQPLHTVYLSLGSNQGNRLEHLQRALERLNRHGRITARSPVYETQAWGFDGPPFLNQVVQWQTSLTPDEILALIKTWEKEAGRQPSAGGSYKNRPLDIDILTYDDRIIRTDKLTVPHPRLAQRRFVLKPWNDIAPAFTVPGTDLTVSELLARTGDTTSVYPYEPLPQALPYSFLTIEGNIGAGKTTLAKMLARDFNGKLILERFEENPFLPKFYEDPERYAFPLEMSFLADRYQQFTDELGTPDLFHDSIISDYYIIKSLIFAGVTLSDDEYALYRKIFNFMYRELRKPELYVYLYRTPEDLLANIARRGRDYEKHITADYLRNVHAAYMQFIQEQTDMPVLILDVTGVDFVAKPEKYREIIREILRQKPEKGAFVQTKIRP